MNAETGQRLHLPCKSDTKHIVQWLADASQQRCNLFALMPALCVSPSPERSTKNPKEVAMTLQLPTSSQWQKLLAEGGPSLPPPARLGDAVIVLRNGLTGRRESAIRHRRRSLADHSHFHFISVVQSPESISRQIQRVCQHISQRQKSFFGNDRYLRRSILASYCKHEAELDGSS